MKVDRKEGLSWDDDLDRLTVAEAAEALGISQDAVRKRIARRTIAADHAPSGRLYVYLPSEDASDAPGAQGGARRPWWRFWR